MSASSIELLGLIAGCLTTASFIPQVIKIQLSGNNLSHKISLRTLLFSMLGTIPTVIVEIISYQMQKTALEQKHEK